MKENIAFDIETKGLAAADGDEITIAGFMPPEDGATIFVNTNGEDVDVTSLIETVENRSREHVTIIPCQDERTLFDSVSTYTDELDVSEERLVAYNGETWNSGFDIPFLRTRCIKTEAEWLFDGVAYADIYEVVQRRFNTKTVEIDIEELNKDPLRDFGTYIGADFNVSSNMSVIKQAIFECGYSMDQFEEWVEHSKIVDTEDFISERNTLDGAHYALFGETDCDYDPFEDSQEAVTAFEEGRWAELVLHNLADIRRTKDLTEVVVKCVWRDVADRYNNSVEEKIL